MSDVQEKRKKGFRLGLAIKRFIFLVLPVLVIGGGVAGTIAMGNLSPEPEEKADVIEALPVLTAYGVSEPVQLRVLSQGEVTARSEVDLAAQISGRLAYVSPKFLPGGRFTKGEMLFRLEDREFQLRIVQAESVVAEARTALIRETSEANQALADAEELGVETVSDFAMRRPQMAQAEARLASTEAALAEARLQLERTTIRAPFDGRVRSKAVDVGAYITPGMALGNIYSTDKVDVPIPLTDKDIAALGLGVGFIETRDAPGPNVTLSAIVGDTPRHWTGRITRTDSGFDPATRVLFAYVTVEDPYGAGADNGTPLATGLFVTADLDGRELVDSVTIPRTALRGASSVYLVQSDDTIEIREVEVASSSRQRVVLTAGLDIGERIITSPVRGAVDGMKVQPVDRLDVATQTLGAADTQPNEQ